MKKITPENITPVPFRKPRLVTSIHALALLSLPVFSTHALASGTAHAATETRAANPTIMLGSKGGNGADGENAGLSANAGQGSHGGKGANGSSGNKGGSGASGINGANGSNGVAGAAASPAMNGSSGSSGTPGANGATGQPGAAETLSLDKRHATFSAIAVGANGGNGGAGGLSSAGAAGGRGGDGGAGGDAGSGGSGGDAGSGSYGGNGGNGGNGGSGAAGGHGADGAAGSRGGNGGEGATGGNGKLSLSGGDFSADSITLGGNGGQAGAASNGSAGGRGADGGLGGSQGQSGSWGASGTSGTVGYGGGGGRPGTGGSGGPGGNGGHGGAGAAGANGGNGAQGGHALLNLDHTRLTVQKTLQAGGAGGAGSRGGNGAQKGQDGETHSGRGGDGANGGMGGAGAAGGNGGQALIHVSDSSLRLHSITLGGEGASGGQGGDASLNAAGGLGGAGGHGGNGDLRFENSTIMNSGILQLGGNGGKSGSDGTGYGASAAGRGGQGGNGGNGYAIFNGGSGQIATDIQLGGKNGGAGLAGSGQLTIAAGSFSANSLSLGQAETENSNDNQYLQTGGVFTTERSALHAGALRIDGGLFASKLLDASRGLIEVTKQAAAIIGTRQLNAERWQQGAEWMAEQQAAPFDGTLVVAAGQSADLSSAEVGWSIGSNDHQQHFTGSSLTVISAKPYVGQNSAPLMTGEGRVDPNAKMMVIADDNLKTTEAFTASLGSSARDGFWQQQNIISTSRLLNMIASSSGNAHRLTAEQAALPLLPQDTADLLANMAKQQGVNTHSADASQRFVSQVMDIRFIRDRVVASRVVQSALHMASVIGVQHTTFMALSAAEQAVAHHLSSDLNGSRSGGNLWATLLSDNSSSHGFSSGDWQARAATNLGGVALGSDFQTDGGDYGSLTSGIALNAGGGKSSSRGNVSPTRNDFNFWGSTLYSRWQRDAASVMADVSYTGSHNRLKQQTPAGVEGSALRAGVNSWAFSSGIKMDYLWQSGLADVKPHAGVRYVLLKSKSFNTHNELGNLFDTASGSQRIWSFPLGISLSKAFTTNAGYQVKPIIDLTWTGNSGDVSAKSRSWMPGEEGSASTTNSTITDHSVFSGKVGIELSHKQLGYSLNYQLNESSHVSDNIIQAGVKLSF